MNSQASTPLSLTWASTPLSLSEAEGLILSDSLSHFDSAQCDNLLC
jgi:hypothetical protein